MKRKPDRVHWDDLQSAFDSRVRSGSIANLKHIDLKHFLNYTKSLIISRLKNALRNDGNLKVNVIFAGKFRALVDGEFTEDNKFFNTENQIILPTTDLDEWFQDYVKEEILVQIEEFQRKESGWSLIEIINLSVNINKYVPLQPGLSTFIELPKHIQNKKAVINIQNDDSYCFLWSVMAALHPTELNVSKTSSYPHFKTELKYEGLNFPINLYDVKKFEKMNGLNINIYGIDLTENRKKDEIVPLYLSNAKKSDKAVIHLLMIENTENQFQDENESVCHFSFIKNLSRLVSTQITRNEHKLFLCDRCLCHFAIDKSFLNHREDCEKANKCIIILPKEGENILKFINHKRKEMVPFVVYADIECLLEPIAETNDENMIPNTVVYQKHVPHSVAFYLKCNFDDSLSRIKVYRGEDCVEYFVKKMKILAQRIDGYLKKIVPMKLLTMKEPEEFCLAKTCHICEKEFKAVDVIHNDHCHFTGTYRGLAHQGCNLNYKISHVLPIVFHNLSGYDSHFIIKALATTFEGRITLLPVNKDCEYLSPNMWMKQKHSKNSNEFELLTRKGVFPYEHVDNMRKLDETELPSKSAFFSQLNDENVSDEDYEHARNVWDMCEIKTLGEYSDLYLKIDVCLLADIFENFRFNCSSTYNLDPLHYFTAPGLAFDAMLKITGIELDLLTDIEMILFIEKGIRGGVSQCSNRYGKANNRYMGLNFNVNIPESYLAYFDLNNQYGTAMCEFLPFSDFMWEDNFQNNFDVNSIADDSPVGCILEVDIEYPEKLHELHKDFPLCPEHFVPPLPGCKIPKLITNLLSKTHYVVHYRNLKQYLSLGMKVTKIHRILQFNQKPWLKEYIDLNTEMRKKSTNEFQKNFYKLMNNAVFGKTLENVRNFKDVRLILRWNGRFGAKDLIARPNFNSCTIFNENMVIIELDRLKVNFNKPIYAGFTVLDVSKIYIYDFHYNYIKKNFDQAKLLYTDTDSLIYHIVTPDIYEYIKRDWEKFDTASFSPDNPYGISQLNNKVLGLMKDENNGKIMTEFIGLRSKLYIFRVLGKKEETKKSKGVRKTTLKTITFEDYKKCLLSYRNLKKPQHSIRSKKHDVHTIKQNKIVLSWQDDKRVLMSGVTDTLPWGFKAG